MAVKSMSAEPVAIDVMYPPVRRFGNIIYR